MYIHQHLWKGLSIYQLALLHALKAFFRLIYSDSSFKDNASKFDIKFNLKTAIDLEANKLTLGEFIYHLLRVNNLDDISSNMTQILGVDFLKGFKQWRKDLDVEVNLFHLSDDEKESLLFNKLSKLFELRHCICHEAYIPVSEEDVKELVSYSRYVREFLSVTEKYVENQIKTNKQFKSDS